jgi:hypothetical protein
MYWSIVQVLSLARREIVVLEADDIITLANNIPLSRLYSLNGQPCCVFDVADGIAIVHSESTDHHRCFLSGQQVYFHIDEVM